MIFLHRLRMNDTKVTADVAVSQVRPLKFLIFLVGQVGHRALELGNDRMSRDITSGENAQLGFASAV